MQFVHLCVWFSLRPKYFTLCSLPIQWSSPKPSDTLAWLTTWLWSIHIPHSDSSKINLEGSFYIKGQVLVYVHHELVSLRLSSHTVWWWREPAGVQLQQPGIQPEEMDGVGQWDSLSVFYGLPVYSKFKIRPEVWHFQFPLFQIYYLHKSLLLFKQSSCFSDSLGISLIIYYLPPLMSYS